MIAVDAGGTHTRVACVALDGAVLGTARGGGGSPTHNHDAREQVRSTVLAAIAAAGLQAQDAVALAAGMAGFEPGVGDEWASDFFALPGLDCSLDLVNDAVAAHRGAFADGAGVMVVAGTGSMILTVTASGEVVESGRYEHYAGGARHLVFEALGRLLTGEAGPEDDGFVAAVLAEWQVDDVANLRQIMLELSDADRNDVKRRYGALAPLVTAWADRSPLADGAVCWLAERTALGVRLLAPHVPLTPAPAALTGALAESDAFSRRLADALRAAPGPRAHLVAARLGPLGGAALLALGPSGVTVDDAILQRLQHAVVA